MGERIERLELRDVHYMPEMLEPGILYVSKEFETAIHACPCGCRQKTVTPLHGDGWKLARDTEGPTLSPSLLQRAGCKVHYFVRNGAIVWC